VLILATRERDSVAVGINDQTDWPPTSEPNAITDNRDRGTSRVHRRDQPQLLRRKGALAHFNLTLERRLEWQIS
jgi:hypothetical protein